jgi:hypothetical protein
MLLWMELGRCPLKVDEAVRITECWGPGNLEMVIAGDDRVMGRWKKGVIFYWHFFVGLRDV